MQGVVPVPTDRITNPETLFDEVIGQVTQAALPQILDFGLAILGSIAVVMLVWRGSEMALSGGVDPGRIITFLFMLSIPFTMLYHYDKPMPWSTLTFPQAIVGQGEWLRRLFETAAVEDAAHTLSRALNMAYERVEAEWEGRSVWGLVLGSAELYIKLVLSSATTFFVVIMLVIVWILTMAQVMVAQIAMAVLILLGPLAIPFLAFPPMSRLFWGWFWGLIHFTLYSAIAGAMLAINVGVGNRYLLAIFQRTTADNVADQLLWQVSVLLYSLAAVWASLKIGSIAGMLAQGAADVGSGFLGAAATVATAGKAAVAKGAAGGAGRTLKGR